MKSAYLNSSTYIDFNKENNKEDIKILKHFIKTFLQKTMVQIGSKK